MLPYAATFLGEFAFFLAPTPMLFFSVLQQPLFYRHPCSDPLRLLPAFATLPLTNEPTGTERSIMSFAAKKSWWLGA